MTEPTEPTAQNTEPPAPPEPTTEPPATGDLGDAGKKALESERQARKDAEKAHNALKRELDDLRKKSMTESEKAVTEAEARGRSAATVDFGKRLARSEFDALAGRRNSDFDTGPVFEYLDLGKFVGDDGEPDGAAITAAVERLVPVKAEGGPPPPVSFDGGPRAATSADDEYFKFYPQAKK